MRDMTIYLKITETYNLYLGTGTSEKLKLGRNVPNNIPKGLSPIFASHIKRI